MQGVLFLDLFDSKVVDNKGEGDWASFVEMHGRSIVGREVPSCGKDFFELLVGKFTSQLEAIHGTSIGIMVGRCIWCNHG